MPKDKRDVNLPMSGATPEAKERAVQQGYRYTKDGTAWRHQTTAGKPVVNRRQTMREISRTR